MQISKEEYAKLNRIIITLKQQKSELQETILEKELLLSKAQDRISKLETSPAFSNVISQVCPTCKGSGEYDHGKGYKSVCYECKGNGKIRT